jgi:exopolysaccharide biosynthesis polyprenyl glycosylphosphotransferase
VNVRPRGTQTGRRANRAPTPVRSRQHERTSRPEASPALDPKISPVWEDVSSQASHPQGFSTAQQRDALLRRALAAVDVLGAYLALAFVLVVMTGGTVRPRLAVVLLGPLILLANKGIGLYDRDQHLLHKTTLDELPSVLQFSAVYGGAVWLGEAVLLHGWLARADVFGLAAATFAFVAVGRALTRHIASGVTPPERCVIVGSARDAHRTARKLASAPGVNAAVIGQIPLRAQDHNHRPEVRVLGEIGNLAQIVAEHRIERVIVAPDSHDQDETLEVIRLVKALGLRVSVLPRLLEAVGSSSTFDEIDGITLLGVRHFGLSRSSELLKRLLDLVGASLCLVLLAPLLLILAGAIKLDSRGPLFFLQPRVGRGGRTFRIVKFRSMVHGADRAKAQLRQQNEAEGGLFKIEADPRITRVGRLLRRTSLDELPQLFNVLAGHMSLVGPRPLVPDEDALIEGWQRRRLAVKPGMTGLWQIFGSSRIPMHEMVKIDYLYGANWSIWLDLKILLRTVPYVLRGRGL